MTLLEKLQSHKGGLLRIKSLFWYGGRGYDNVLGRICLLLDADRLDRAAAARSGCFACAASTTSSAAAHLLIDGSHHWVWVVEKDVEVISDPS